MALLPSRLREVSPLAVFTLSHVHVPQYRSTDFEKAAKWLLPRCRLREASSGQVFEHLHRRRPESSPDLAPPLPYHFNAANAGFEQRNVGREPAALSSGGAFAGAAVSEFCWFEEWAGWEGVEAHGGTGHGQRFHGAVDGFIEEEWTVRGKEERNGYR
jgi:hypothetical protein